VTAFVVEFDGFDGDGFSEGQIRPECSARGGKFDVLVSEGQLVDDDGPIPCPAARNLSGRQPRDLYYAGGDEVEGTYHFIVDKRESEFRDDLEDYYGSILDSVSSTLERALLSLIGDSLDEDNIYHETPSDGHPYTTTAAYNATAELTYADDGMRYGRNVTIPSDS